MLFPCSLVTLCHRYTCAHSFWPGKDQVSLVQACYVTEEENVFCPSVPSLKSCLKDCHTAFLGLVSVLPSCKLSSHQTSLLLIFPLPASAFACSRVHTHPAWGLLHTFALPPEPGSPASPPFLCLSHPSSQGSANHSPIVFFSFFVLIIFIAL